MFPVAKNKGKKYVWNDVLQEVCLDFGSHVKPRWKKHNGGNGQAILPGRKQHEKVRTCVHQGLLRITVPVVSVEGEAAPAVAGLQEPLVS